MKYHVLTLFPEMIEQGLRTSILGRAMEKGIISLEAVDIRDFTEDRHRKVDDYPYGGGAGMVMQADPTSNDLVFLWFSNAGPPIHSRRHKTASSDLLAQKTNRTADLNGIVNR